MIWLARFWSWQRLRLLAWVPPECIYQKFGGLWGCGWMADGFPPEPPASRRPAVAGSCFQEFVDLRFSVTQATHYFVRMLADPRRNKTPSADPGMFFIALHRSPK
jgi:hypothetical protein